MDPKLKERIRQRIIKLRTDHGFSQITVAEHLKMSTKRYQAYEYNFAQPPLEVMISLCKLYCIDTIDELIFGEKRPVKNGIIDKYKKLNAERKRIVDLLLNEA